MFAGEVQQQSRERVLEQESRRTGILINNCCRYIGYKKSWRGMGGARQEAIVVSGSCFIFCISSVERGFRDCANRYYGQIKFADEVQQQSRERVLEQEQARYGANSRMTIGLITSSLLC